LRTKGSWYKKMFDFLRDRTKSSSELKQEALGAYLDNALAPAERQQVERQLAQDARLRAELQQLRVLKQQLAQMPRRRVPRNFTLDPAVYGRPQRQPLLKLYPVLQGATALAALIFILVLGLGFFQGQFSGGVPGAAVSETALVETTRVVGETVTEEQAEAPLAAPAAEELAAEEPTAEDALVLGEPAEEPVEEAAAEPTAEAAAAAVELLQEAPLTETLTADVPAVGGALTDTFEAETLEGTTTAAVGTAAVAADLAREGESAATEAAAATEVAVAESEPFEVDAESAEVANQPAGTTGLNLLTLQVVMGILLIALVILLLLARRRLSRW
jgi:anti-sigma factor RsiW